MKDAAHLKEVLKELYAEFLATGKIACESVGSALRPFGPFGRLRDLGLRNLGFRGVQLGDRNYLRCCPDKKSE